MFIFNWDKFVLQLIFVLCLFLVVVALIVGTSAIDCLKGR